MPILENKAMYAIFQKKRKEGQQNVKKGQERAKYLKIWAKMYKNWKSFEKGHLISLTARIGPDMR